MVQDPLDFSWVGEIAVAQRRTEVQDMGLQSVAIIFIHQRFKGAHGERFGLFRIWIWNIKGIIQNFLQIAAPIDFKSGIFDLDALVYYLRVGRKHEDAVIHHQIILDALKYFNGGIGHAAVEVIDQNDKTVLIWRNFSGLRA